MQSVVGIPGYNVISELRNTIAPRSFRAREADGDVVTLHLFPRASVSRADLAAAQAELPRFADWRHARVGRLRRLRADDESILVETDHLGAESLDSLLAREGKLEPARALKIAEDLLVALVAAEMRGVTHGFIRPAAVLLDRDGHAGLDGFGFAGFAEPVSDFYGSLARFVPVPADQRHAKDVYAIGALLFHMVAGRPPFDGRAGDVKSRIRREPFPASVVSNVTGAVTPLGKTEAGTVLRLIRECDIQSPTAPAPVSTPTLLDVVEMPPEPPKEPKGARLRETLKGAMSTPAWPALSAALVGLFTALIFAGPFLGGESVHVRDAQPLPASTPLAVEAPKAAEKTEIKAPAAAAKPPERNLLREQVIALADIGDYRGALERLREARDWTADELKEEVGAVLAKANDRWREIHELARALASEGLVKEAEREWDALAPHWPTRELTEAAKVEREKLGVIAKELQEQRAQQKKEREWRRLEAELVELGVDTIGDETYEYAARLKAIEDLFQKAVKSDSPGIRDDAEALLQAVMAERDLFELTAEHLDKKFRKVALGSVTQRFGSGEVAKLTSKGIDVRRQDATSETIALTRLTKEEKYAFFNQFRNPRTGRQALGLGMMCLRWGLIAQARNEFSIADGAAECPVRALAVARRILEEVER